MDVPSGTIKAFVKTKNKKVNSVRFINVPSFVEKLDAEISTPKLGLINYDLAFGGAYYRISRCRQVVESSYDGSKEGLSANRFRSYRSI